ncbi:MAG: transporter substrate-binding domain-containing protein, partial [Cellulomonadaceae bacterium]
MVTRKRSAAALAALAASVLVLSACGGGDGTDPSPGGGGDETTTAEGDGDKGTLTVGVKFDQPGMGLSEGGEIVGLDADMARAIAERMGYDITFTEAISAQRETLLENGTVDMILATYTINDARDEVIDWAGPYFHAGQDILVPADNTDITGPEDLNNK